MEVIYWEKVVLELTCQFKRWFVIVRLGLGCCAVQLNRAHDVSCGNYRLLIQLLRLKSHTVDGLLALYQSYLVFFHFNW